jgi:hypothetical protein
MTNNTSLSGTLQEKTLLSKEAAHDHFVGINYDDDENKINIWA